MILRYIKEPLSVSPYVCNTNIAPLVAGALIAGGASLAGGVLSGLSNKASSEALLQSTRETNEANKEMNEANNKAKLDLYRESYADSIEQWNRENVYNSPSEQAARYRAAGINPALAISGQNVSNSAALPSAPELQASHYDSAPSTAYTDTFLSGFVQSLPQIGDSIEKYERIKSANIDNQTRDAMNRANINDAYSRIEQRLAQNDVSRAERKRLESVKASLDLENDLLRARFDDNVKLTNLQTKYQEIQNRVLDDQNRRDAERLAIEKYEAYTHRKLTDAQVSQIGVLTNIAVAADWRSQQQHVLDSNLKALDEAYKRVQLDAYGKRVAVEEILRNSDLYHEGLKDASLINRLAERAFGLGFRDLGAALRNLLSK